MIDYADPILTVLTEARNELDRNRDTVMKNRETEAKSVGIPENLIDVLMYQFKLEYETIRGELTDRIDRRIAELM